MKKVMLALLACVLIAAGVVWYLLAQERREPVTDGTLVYREVTEEPA